MNNRLITSTALLYMLFLLAVLCTIAACGKEGGKGDPEGPGCDNSCATARDGWCQDDTYQSNFGAVDPDEICPCGTDCADCGTRTEKDCAKGQIVLWSDDLSYTFRPWTIFWYLEEYTITVAYTDANPPNCGDPGVITIEDNPGVYGFSWAKDNEIDNDASVDIIADVCTRIKLPK